MLRSCCVCQERTETYATQRCELAIPDMLSDEVSKMNFRGPKSLGGSPIHIYLYVADVDRIVAQATATGATILMAVEDQFWGDRTGTFEDPFGHVWYVSTHKEDLSEEELKMRLDEARSGS